ncbi:MAG TPA: VWA domain-containing protein, partial [Pyrinomonadaceae bacterium]|nr:VWA domain-containing protein [Pyrinomonadaceae bacterium]
MKVLLICLFVLLLAAPCVAQDDDVVRVKSNLVNIDVMVKDKKGKYIADLKAEDFIIFENGVQQKIEFFDAPLVGNTNRTPAAPTGEVKAEPGVPPGLTRNYVTLVVDTQNTDITNLKQVREGTIKYIREQVTDADVVALLTVTNGLQLLQPFTHDKTKLIAALENLGVRAASKSLEQANITENINSLRSELQGANGAPIDNQASGSNAARIMIMQTMLAQFIKLRTALSLQQSRPVLAAVAAICEGLRTIPGKKTLVLFSQGFVTPAVLDWQVQSTIDIANRANVAIYIIDSA